MDGTGCLSHPVSRKRGSGLRTKEQDATHGLEDEDGTSFPIDRTMTRTKRWMDVWLVDDSRVSDSSVRDFR